MEDFIESFDSFRESKKRLDEDDNVELTGKLNGLIEKARKAKTLYEEAKSKYDNHVLNPGNDTAKEIELLTYRKYKGMADMLNAEVRLAQLQKKKIGDIDPSVLSHLNPLK